MLTFENCCLVIKLLFHQTRPRRPNKLKRGVCLVVLIMTYMHGKYKYNPVHPSRTPNKIFLNKK